MARRRKPRARWELYARPALALVFITCYRLAACGDDPTPDPVPQPPAWVQEDAR